MSQLMVSKLQHLYTPTCMCTYLKQIEEINGLIASYLERFLQLESDEETGLMNYDVTPTQYMETYHKSERATTINNC